LIKTLTEHASLAQSALNAQVVHHNLLHLLHCRTKFNEFSGFVSGGDLPQAVAVSGELSKLLDGTPLPLGDAEVMKGLKVFVI
jgi:centromere/kinetochore protein ZW10